MLDDLTPLQPINIQAVNVLVDDVREPEESKQRVHLLK